MPWSRQSRLGSWQGDRCFIILRGMSLMGDATLMRFYQGSLVLYLRRSFLSGRSSLGSWLPWLLPISPITVWSKAIRNRYHLSSFLALGVILIGVANSSTDLFHILFGNVLAVQDSDKWLTIAIAILVLAVIILSFRPLLITSFDPMMAKAFGMKVQSLLIDVLVNFGFSDSDAKRRNDLDRGFISHSSSNGLFIYKQLKHMMVIAGILGGFASFIGLFIGTALILPQDQVLFWPQDPFSWSVSCSLTKTKTSPVKRWSATAVFSNGSCSWWLLFGKPRTDGQQKGNFQ